MTESERLLRQLSRTSDPVEAWVPPMSVRHRDYEPPQALVKLLRRWGFQASNIRRKPLPVGRVIVPFIWVCVVATELTAYSGVPASKAVLRVGVIVMGFTLYGIDIPLWLLFSLALIGLVTCVVGGTVGVVTIIRRLMRNGQAIDWRTTRQASGTPILRAR